MLTEWTAGIRGFVFVEKCTWEYCSYFIIERRNGSIKDCLVYLVQ